MPRHCKNGFIQTYIEYCKGHQAPQIFHIWTAIAIITGILGRKIWMDRSYYTLYPNLYAVLVSESGVGMKSTTIDIGMDLITKAGITTNTLLGKITPTRLFTRLLDAQTKNPSGNAELTIHSREFRVFIKGIIRDSSLIEDLTNMYDCKPVDYETEHGIRQQVKKPCLNIRAASTPEWLSGGSIGDIMSGGFGARILPISLLKDEKQIAWPKKPPVDLHLEEMLINDLIAINNLMGQFYVTPAAEEYFDVWYKERDKYKNPDMRLKGYYSKKHDTVLKVSMILSTSMNDDLVVDVQHIESALALLQQVERDILFAYTGVTSSEKTRYYDRVLQKIKEKGEITHTELHLAFRSCVTGKELVEIVQSLEVDDGLIRREVRGKTKPQRVYVWVGDRKEEEK